MTVTLADIGAFLLLSTSIFARDALFPFIAVSLFSVL